MRGSNGHHRSVLRRLAALALAWPCACFAVGFVPPDAVEQATGIRPPLPPRMADLYDRPERVSRVANDLTALQSFVRERRRP